MGKQNRHLTSEQASHLGLKVKPNQEGRNTARYFISDELYQKALYFKAEGILDSSNKAQVDPRTVKHLWKEIRDEDGKKEGNLFIKNPLYVSPLEKTYLDLRDEILSDLKKYSPKFSKIRRKKKSKGHLLVIDPADIHIGKLATAFESGDEYNSKIAVKRVLEGITGILDKCKGFEIDQILFIGGNDILHIDTPKRTTTSGTPQDTDGMWYDNFLIAKQLYLDCLERLLPVADVQFMFNPSNHDYTNGFFLADVIQTYFRKNKNISFDCSISHRKYYRYHENLIGTTHGDGAKTDLLPMLMAQEAPQDWAKTKHRYVYTHHVHHKTSKDFIGVTVESLRSPSGTDSWHHRNGYQHAPKAVEGFLHDKKHGQIARLTNIF